MDYFIFIRPLAQKALQNNSDNIVDVAEEMVDAIKSMKTRFGSYSNYYIANNPVIAFYAAKIAQLSHASNPRKEYSELLNEIKELSKSSFVKYLESLEYEVRVCTDTNTLSVRLNGYHAPVQEKLASLTTAYLSYYEGDDNDPGFSVAKDGTYLVVTFG